MVKAKSNLWETVIAMTSSQQRKDINSCPHRNYPHIAQTDLLASLCPFSLHKHPHPAPFSNLESLSLPHSLHSHNSTRPSSKAKTVLNAASLKNIWIPMISAERFWPSAMTEGVEMVGMGSRVKAACRRVRVGRW